MEGIWGRKAHAVVYISEYNDHVANPVALAPNARLTQKARGADDCSDSEYELDAEEEAHVEEEDLGDEEEVALAKSKAMVFMQTKKTSTIIRTQVPLSFSKTAIQTARLIACAESGLLAHNAMEKKREAQSEGEQPVSDTAIVAEVLKEESSHSTVLSSMGHREELAARLEARERAFQEIQKKQQEELEALKKSQQEKNEAWAKKQKETDNLLDFLRAQATLQSQSQPDGS
ncbi:hypothetical protein VPH35_139003 [Triticum aestivum]